MSGFSIADLHDALVRSLRGQCLRVADGLVARNGDRHEHCGTCQTKCGGEVLGFSGGVEVARVWGSDAIELRWPCPGCGCETTQETTALDSMKDAAEVLRDGNCHKCRAVAPCQNAAQCNSEGLCANGCDERAASLKTPNVGLERLAEGKSARSPG